MNSRAYATLLVAILALCGCASGATVQGMSVTSADLKGPASKELEHAVAVGHVEGGKSTNVLWTSQIDNASFKAALVSSLRRAGLLSNGPAAARYKIEVSLLDLEQPLVAFDMKVTSKIRYTLTDTTTGAVVFDEAIVAPYTATVNDAFVGVKRLRLANEGSARKSISSLIAKLNACKVHVAPAVARLDGGASLR
jgi:hypothetical protein